MPPAKFPCIDCKRAVKKKDQAVQCEKCEKWQHLSCNRGNTGEKYTAYFNLINLVYLYTLIQSYVYLHVI